MHFTASQLVRLANGPESLASFETGQQQAGVLCKPPKNTEGLSGRMGQQQGEWDLCNVAAIDMMRAKFPIVVLDKIVMPNESSEFGTTSATALPKTTPNVVQPKATSVAVSSKATPAVASSKAALAAVSSKATPNGLSSKRSPVAPQAKATTAAVFSKPTSNGLQSKTVQIVHSSKPTPASMKPKSTQQMPKMTKTTTRKLSSQFYHFPIYFCFYFGFFLPRK